MKCVWGADMAGAGFNRIVRERASWAVSAQYVNYGKMKEVDENNVQTGEFSAKDLSFAGYFSYMLANRLTGGISARLITSYLGSYNSIGFGVDLGLNYYDSDHEWSLALVLKNLGGQLKAYHDNFERMPFDIQMGVTKRFTGTPFRLHATLVDLNHLDYKFLNHVVVGADVLLTESIWIGGGYNFRRADEMKITTTNGSSSHGAGFSCGAGLNLERFKLNLAYGKYHVSSSSLVLNVAYEL